MQSAAPVPPAFLVIDAGITDVRGAVLDINVFNCLHVRANEFLLRETDKSLS